MLLLMMMMLLTPWFLLMAAALYELLETDRPCFVRKGGNEEGKISTWAW